MKLCWLSLSTHFARKVWILTPLFDSFYDLWDFASSVISSWPLQCKKKIKMIWRALWVLAIKTSHGSCLLGENITLPFNKRIQLNPPCNLSPSHVLMSYVKDGNGISLSRKTKARANSTSTPNMVMNLNIPAVALTDSKNKKMDNLVCSCLLPRCVSPGFSSMPLALLRLLFFLWLNDAMCLETPVF